jgi:hypothetical protein
VSPHDRPGDRTYEIRLTGEVTEAELAAALGHVSVVQHDTRTVLSGRFTDQATLYRLLRLARSYGLDVLEIRRVSRGVRRPRLEEQA